LLSGGPANDIFTRADRVAREVEEAAIVSAESYSESISPRVEF